METKLSPKLETGDRKDFRNPEHFSSEVGLSTVHTPPYESLRTDHKAT
jgi:hypothetical protein